MNRRNMRTAYGEVWRRILDLVFCVHIPAESSPSEQRRGPDLFATTVVVDDQGAENKDEAEEGKRGAVG